MASGIMESIGKKHLERLQVPPYPYILCRRTDMRRDATYNLHDAGWEGLQSIGRKPDGTTKWGIHHNFNLIIHYEGQICFIPKTPNNEKKLKTQSEAREFIEKVKDKEGKETGKEIRHLIEPQYVRVSESVLSQTIEEEMYQRFKQRFLEEQAQGEIEDLVDVDAREDESVPEAPREPRRRGRPPRSLTEPIPRG